MKTILVITMVIAGATTVQKQPAGGMHECMLYEAPRVLDGLAKALNIDYLKVECVQEARGE